MAVVPETTNNFLCPRVVVGTVLGGELLQLAFACGKGSCSRALSVMLAFLVPAFQVAVSLCFTTHWSFDVALAIIIARARPGRGEEAGSMRSELFPVGF